MRRFVMALGMVLLLTLPLMGSSCGDGEPSPGPVIVIGISDHDPATSEWKKDGGATQERTASSSGGKIREDFVGTKINELKCDETEVDELALTLDESGGTLKIKRSSLGLQWCWDLGSGNEACLLAREHDGSDTIPSDFKDPVSIDGTTEAGGSYSCTEATFQVKL